MHTGNTPEEEEKYVVNLSVEKLSELLQKHDPEKRRTTKRQQPHTQKNTEQVS